MKVTAILLLLSSSSTLVSAGIEYINGVPFVTGKCKDMRKPAAAGTCSGMYSPQPGMFQPMDKDCTLGSCIGRAGQDCNMSMDGKKVVCPGAQAAAMAPPPKPQQQGGSSRQGQDNRFGQLDGYEPYMWQQ